VADVKDSPRRASDNDGDLGLGLAAAAGIAAASPAARADSALIRSSRKPI
jgi:hypothetical protein